MLCTQVSLLLYRRRGTHNGGDRPAGLGEAGRPGFFPVLAHFFGTLVPATTTHPKLVALVRNKQNMYGT